MPIKLKKSALDHLTSLHTRAQGINNNLSMLRRRFTMIDMAMERTSEVTLEKLKSIRSAELGRKDRMRNLEVPIIAENVDTLHTKLCDRLTTGYPIFAMIGQPSNTESLRVANQWTALMEQDQDRFGWKPELMDTLLDSVKYNVAAVELTWATGTSSAMVVQTAGQQRVAQSTPYSGCKIRNIDKYNFVFDPTVPLHLLQSRGVYAGYIERMSFLNVVELMAEQNPDYRLVDVLSNALLHMGSSNNYDAPDLHPLESYKQTGSETDWATHFGVATPSSSLLSHVGKYEVFTLYYRCIPQHIGISAKDFGQASANKPVVFKLLFIGTQLVYAEPLTLPFGGLPIFASHLCNSTLGFRINSFAENLDDLQDAGSAMLNGSIASMRKAVSDRMLYDPRFIKSEDINSPNPSSKIPVRVFGMGNKLSDSYAVVPYRDDISQWLMQHMQLINNMASSVSGINKATQGNFTKGNRTMQEFNTVVDNSEARLHKYAENLEARFFAPLKQALKLLYLQNVTGQDIVSRTLEQTVRVDPIAMLKNEVAFRMADGLNSAAKQLNTEVLTAALTTLAQNPVIGQQYDSAAVYADLLLSAKVDISKYRIQQQPTQQQQTPPSGGQ